MVLAQLVHLPDAVFCLMQARVICGETEATLSVWEDNGIILYKVTLDPDVIFDTDKYRPEGHA